MHDPVVASWVYDKAAPYAVQGAAYKGSKLSKQQALEVRRAFYALCTHIDHQIRVLIGTLREEGILSNTIICFTSDHGDMLGNHDMWAKRMLYEPSANVPMILVGAAGDARVPEGTVDNRVVGWQDIMPTLLDLCHIATPKTVEAMSMVGSKRRDSLYCDVGEDLHASRMV